MKTIEDQICQRLGHIHGTINRCNTAITELQIISDEYYSANELKIVNSHTFNFYRATLQYCFIMEYTKLLELGEKRTERHVASLQKLNEIINQDKTREFQTRFDKNEQLIEEIRSSDFYGKVRKLRDKKFAHSDGDEINDPFKIKGFQTPDFDAAFKHLRMIIIVLNNFGSIYNRIYGIEVPNRDDRTKNFIKFHSEYQSYYMKNYFTAKNSK